jgi:hypothetical protein
MLFVAAGILFNIGKDMSMIAGKILAIKKLALKHKVARIVFVVLAIEDINICVIFSNIQLLQKD